MPASAATPAAAAAAAAERNALLSLSLFPLPPRERRRSSQFLSPRFRRRPEVSSYFVPNMDVEQNGVIDVATILPTTISIEAWRIGRWTDTRPKETSWESLIDLIQFDFFMGEILSLSLFLSAFGM